jgi:hypothetical protein
MKTLVLTPEGTKADYSAEIDEALAARRAVRSLFRQGLAVPDSSAAINRE